MFILCRWQIIKTFGCITLLSGVLFMMYSRYYIAQTSRSLSVTFCCLSFYSRLRLPCYGRGGYWIIDTPIPQWLGLQWDLISVLNEQIHQILRARLIELLCNQLQRVLISHILDSNLLFVSECINFCSKLFKNTVWNRLPHLSQEFFHSAQGISSFKVCCAFDITLCTF